MSTARIITFYKPLAQGTQEMLNYTDAILSSGDEKTIVGMRAGGFQAPIPMYMRSDAIQEVATGVQPQHNQAAYKIGDWDDISKKHKDWFLLDKSGNRIPASTAAKKFWMMDWGNKDWQAFWVARAKAAMAVLGLFYGVFMDNVECSLGRRTTLGPLPVKYPTDAAYQEAVLSMLTAVKTGIQPVYCNLIARRNNDIVDTYFKAADGGMIECWSVDWNNGYLSFQDWLANISLVSARPNARFILVAQGNQDDAQRQNFAFCSYMLVMRDGVSFRYSNADGSYNQSWMYPNYKLDLGAPHSPVMENGDFYFRLFEKGYVEVNPSTLVANIVGA
jgi:hypothetical protein